MTIDEMIAVLQAAKEGKNIQMKHHYGNNPEWKDVESSRLGWDFSCFDYRVKSEPLEIEAAVFPDGSFCDPRYFQADQAGTKIRKFREVIE